MCKFWEWNNDPKLQIHIIYIYIRMQRKETKCITFIKDFKEWGVAENKEKTIPWQILHTWVHILYFIILWDIVIEPNYK